MPTIKDLTPEIVSKIHSYALEDTCTKDDTNSAPSSHAQSLLNFSLVNQEWKCIIHTASSIESWRVACQSRFPNSSASTIQEYKLLLSPPIQSAARVLQRYFFKIACDKATWWRGPLDAPLSPFSIAPCCVCGVRFDLRMLNSCWIAHCKSNFSICEVCEEKCPERSMGRAVGLRARVPACFGCKDNGSVCDRKKRGKLMLRAFASQ